MRGGACVFFFKRKTAYERRISDWSSDVCTSGLEIGYGDEQVERMAFRYQRWSRCVGFHRLQCIEQQIGEALAAKRRCEPAGADEIGQFVAHFLSRPRRDGAGYCVVWLRSEEHTSELQSLMRTSYAVFCLKKKKTIAK